MLLSLRLRSSFSALTAASALVEGSSPARPEPSPAEPVVTPAARLDAPPEDCAVPALLVPGVDGLEFACAKAALVLMLASRISAAKADRLVIGQSPSMIQRRGAGPGSRGPPGSGRDAACAS